MADPSLLQLEHDLEVAEARRAEAAQRLRAWRALSWNAKRQQLQIEVGERLLRNFPFLRPPAKWAAERLDRLARWWSR